jgi:iron complex outermembrane receptor protein
MQIQNMMSPLGHRTGRLKGHARLAASLATTMMAPMASMAMAQEVAPQVPADIVVTAQRRATPLNDTPVAITALSSQDLANRQVRTARDLVGAVPNLGYTDPGTSLQFNIRGQALIDVSDVNEAPVAMYVDDVYVAATAGQGSQLFDMERVEVLRGPQGTLFGRNASAGLIQFISRAPTDHLDGYLTAQYGSYDQVIVEGAVGGPIAKGIRGRASFQRNVDDGYQKNLGSGGGRFGKTDTWSGRAQLVFDLGPDASLLLRGYGTRQRNVHALYPYMGRLDADGNECSVSATLASQCQSATGYRVANPEPDEGYSEHKPSEIPDDVDLYGSDAHLTWKLGNITLTSITAYSHLKRTVADDADASDVGIGNYGDFQYTEIFKVRQHQFSQELRLAGGGAGLNWTAGGYYFDDHRNVLLTQEELASEDKPFDTIGTVKSRSAALFGQADYALSSQLTVSGGLRYTHDRKTADVSTCNQFSACANIYSGRFETTGNNVSGRLGLEWRPEAHWLLYATASSGYKSGEFNVTFLGGTLDNAEPVGAEKTYNFEAGSKKSLFGGMAQLNVALFYTLTKDKQAIATTGLSSSTLMNIGDVNSYGAEIELKARPSSWLDMEGSIGLLRAKIDAPSDVVVYRNYNSDALGLDGNTMPNSPGFSVNGLIRPTVYDGKAGKLDLQGDFHWQTKTELDVANSPYDRQGSYGWLNLGVFWADQSNRFNASFVVKNVTNAEWYSRASSISGLDYRFNTWGSRPRTMALTAGMNF